MHNIEDTEHYILETVFASNQVSRELFDNIKSAFGQMKVLVDTYIDIARFNIMGFITDGNGTIEFVSKQKYDKTGKLVEAKAYLPEEDDVKETPYIMGVDWSESECKNDEEIDIRKFEPAYMVQINVNGQECWYPANEIFFDYNQTFQYIRDGLNNFDCDEVSKDWAKFKIVKFIVVNGDIKVLETWDYKED